MTEDGRDDDVVAQDRGRFPLPGVRLSGSLSRGSLVLAAVTLLAGLGAGYAAGQRHAGGGATAPQRPRTSAAGVTPASPVTALIQTPGACSTQIGRDSLQLGVQFMNQSATQVALRWADAVVPMGGLRAISQDWGPCGVLPASLDPGGNLIAPGASAWFTMTFKVLTKCPGPLPVQFSIGYDVDGHHAVASLPGFPDLSQVRYTGCPPN